MKWVNQHPLFFFFICNRLIIRVNLPFRAFTSCYCSTTRENAKTPYQIQNQLLKSMRDHSKSRTFKNLDHALGLFDTMLHMHPLPSILNFNHMFSSIARMKHYSEVITLIQQMESFGISPDVYTLTVLFNCYCLLNRVDFGFSILANLGTWPTKPVSLSLLLLIVDKNAFICHSGLSPPPTFSPL